MMRSLRAAILLAAAVSLSCPARAEEVPFTILQFNDVYEIVPLQAGGPRLLARAGTLRANLLKENRRTYSVIAGDFFSPSPMMDAKDAQGHKLAGRQMVGVLEALGLDYATFGNHEFDLKRDDFYRWFGDAEFQWFSSNVSKPDGAPFHGVPRSRVLVVRGDAGTEVRVGLIGLTIDSNKADYVRYGDPIVAARAQVTALRGACDVLVAVTHLERVEDKRLSAAIPEIDLILGGHDHVRSYDLPDLHRHAPVSKADANARSAFVHRLSYDTRTRVLRVRSELVDLEKEKLADDPQTDQAITTWRKIAFDGLRGNIKDPALKKILLDELAKQAGGKAPAEVDFDAGLVRLPTELDGRETSVRFGPANLTNLLTQLMLENLKPGSEPGLAILNSGSVRIDAKLPVGMIRLYDIYRVLPYTVRVVSVRMKGRLIKDLLFKGTSKEMLGEGAYLQTSMNVDTGDDPGQFKVDKKPIEDETIYRVAISDYLLKGEEARLGGVIKWRLPKEELTSLDLTRDKVRLMGIDETGRVVDDPAKKPWSVDEQPDLLTALIKALIAHQDDPAYFAKLGAEGKGETPEKWPEDLTYRLEVQCGMTTSDDGYPTPMPSPSASPSAPPVAAEPPHPSAPSSPHPPETTAPAPQPGPASKDSEHQAEPCCHPWVELVKALAWPVAVLVLALLFRGALRHALDRMTHVKSSLFEGEFKSGLKEVEIHTRPWGAGPAAARPDAATESLVSLAAGEPAPAPPPDDPDSSEMKDRLAQIAEIDPRGAILDAWKFVEEAAARAIGKLPGRKRPVADERDIARGVRELATRKPSDINLLLIYDRLRQLKDQAERWRSSRFGRRTMAKNYVKQAMNYATSLPDLQRGPSERSRCDGSAPCRRPRCGWRVLCRRPLGSGSSGEGAAPAERGGALEGGTGSAGASPSRGGLQ